jgi:hypothetical protein
VRRLYRGRRGQLGERSRGGGRLAERVDIPVRQPGTQHYEAAGRFGVALPAWGVPRADASTGGERGAHRAGAIAERKPGGQRADAYAGAD